MNQAQHILIHYGEIALKGKNRPQFVGRLVQNIRNALNGLPVGRIEKLTGRLCVTALPGETLGAEALERLGTVFGISGFSPAIQTDLNMDAIKKAAWSLMEPQQYESFRVTARRAFKDLPYPSIELNEQVGGYILERRPSKVKMKGADVELYIEEIPSGCYLYVEKFPGLGGLPVGISGTVTGLLSGGIDSPVAMFRMQRRGVRVIFVHFHGHPFQTRASQEKVLDLAHHLARYQNEAVVYMVPFGELQRDVTTSVPPALRVVLYRRFMLRIAATLAKRDGAKALVTGESLGQVASQTLSNMVAIEEASPMTILRPLIGFDKQEIIDQARALGTFETSIIPDQDCCQLFMPRSPETHAKLWAVQAAEELLDIPGLCKAALDRVERQVVRAPWCKVPPGQTDSPKPEEPQEGEEPEDEAAEPDPETLQAPACAFAKP